MIKVYDRVNNKSNHTYLAVCLFNTNEIFSGEDWLKQNHREVYDSYESAIDAYTQGHAGACIESCRTCLVSNFSGVRMSFYNFFTANHED